LILSIPSHRDGARTTETSRAIVVKKNYRLQDIQLSVLRRASRATGTHEMRGGAPSGVTACGAGGRMFRRHT
jgi:hypothetical protein